MKLLLQEAHLERVLFLQGIAHQQHLMVSTGWTPKTREPPIIFHVHLHKGKVWIEWDGTHPSIIEELIQRGIQSSELVLNWHDPDVRVLTEA